MRILIQSAQILGHYIKSLDEMVLINCLISAGKITKISKDKIFAPDALLIDARGMFLSPGLIDPQVHFREPGMEYKEDLESGCKSAVAGGFTTVICMPNTDPVADTPEVISYILKKQKDLGICRVYPTAAITKELKGMELSDFESLKRAGAIAFTDDGKGVQNNELFFEAMKNADKVECPILDHSEDETKSFKGKINSPESEWLHVQRGCEMAMETNARYHALHVSTKESFKFIQTAKRQGLNVTCEVSPHHLLLTFDDIPIKENLELDSNWKMNPPLRNHSDREACEKALIEGLIDAIATDHAPHTLFEKDTIFSEAPFGIIGLETSFPLMYTHFVKTKKISLRRLVEMMTLGPATIFNLSEGKFEEGGIADLALFDLDRDYIVNKKRFASKSKNTPFDGWRLYGKARLTIFEGKIVYNDLS